MRTFNEHERLLRNAPGDYLIDEAVLLYTRLREGEMQEVNLRDAALLFAVLRMQIGNAVVTAVERRSNGNVLTVVAGDSINVTSEA